MDHPNVLLLSRGNAVLQTRHSSGNHLDKGAGNIFQHRIAARNAQKKSRKELEKLVMQISYKRMDCLTLLGIEGFEENEEYDNDEWFDEDEHAY